MRSRPALPIRVRLTAVFALVVAIALALTGIAVYLVFRHGLDQRIDEELADRQGQLEVLADEDSAPARIVARAGDPYVQIYRQDGRLGATSASLGAVRLISPAQVAQARRAALVVTRTRLLGLGDGARVRAFAVPGGVAAIAEPLDDRERTLHRLAVILGLALPLALVIASAAGYRVARAALIPVESMRAQAAAIGASNLARRLAVPPTGDELERLAATLNDLLSRLERAVEHERRIVGDASHELRTPVTVLLTRLEVALRGDLDRDGLHEVVTQALGDARRLARLAEDLLLLARADQGGLPVRPVPVEVHDLLEAVAARHRDGAAPRSVRVVSQIPDGAVVFADPDRANQVIDNLLVNALRHGQGEIELRVERAGDYVAIGVRDHGEGFPPDFVEHAFDRFAQARTGRAGGGLGLAIVAALVQAHGGTVSAANHPDGGALTTFTLPLA